MFLAKDKPQVKVLSSPCEMVEVQLGLKSNYSGVSLAITKEAELHKSIQQALETNAFLVITLEKYTLGHDVSLEDIEIIETRKARKKLAIEFG